MSCEGKANGARSLTLFALLAAAGCNALFGIDDADVAGEQGGAAGQPAGSQGQGGGPAPAGRGGSGGGSGAAGSSGAGGSAGSAGGGAGPLLVRRFVAGGAHTCALVKDERVQCWGKNELGQLGSTAGSGLDQPNVSPTFVKDQAGGDLLGVAELAAGYVHTCARFGDGRAQCWGGNHRGQLGVLTGSGSLTPQPVPAFVQDAGGAELSGVVEIAVGVAHTCARLADGRVKCWGSNDSGQLGNSVNLSTLEANPVPVFVQDTGGGDLRDVTRLGLGAAHSCALLVDGRVKCWGRNSYGQLGQAVATGPDVPIPTATLVQQDGANLVGVVELGLGASHTCARLADGRIKCWGWNSFGQLGTPVNYDTGTPNPLPAFVESSETGQTIDDVVEIGVNSAHTCARFADGHLECWGYNSHGELGRPNISGTISSPTPGAVIDGSAPLSGASELAIGEGHGCVRAADGNARCWGSNLSGQLGNANGVGLDGATPPLPVVGLAPPP